jgi:hypothetical protein
LFQKSLHSNFESGLNQSCLYTAQGGGGGSAQLFKATEHNLNTKMDQSNYLGCWAEKGLIHKILVKGLISGKLSVSMFVAPLITPF